MKLGRRPLQRPRKIWNIDNTANHDGPITHYVDLDIQTNRTRKMIRFLITNIGNEDVILGYPWMAVFEPQFLWRTGTINEQALPVIIRSVNPSKIIGEQIIAQARTGDEQIRATTRS